VSELVIILENRGFVASWNISAASRKLRIAFLVVVRKGLCASRRSETTLDRGGRPLPPANSRFT